jgi:hypothetical protein
VATPDLAIGPGLKMAAAIHGFMEPCAGDRGSNNKEYLGLRVIVERFIACRMLVVEDRRIVLYSMSQIESKESGDSSVLSIVRSFVGFVGQPV